MFSSYGFPAFGSLMLLHAAVNHGIFGGRSLGLLIRVTVPNDDELKYRYKLTSYMCMCVSPH